MWGAINPLPQYVFKTWYLINHGIRLKHLLQFYSHSRSHHIHPTYVSFHLNLTLNWLPLLAPLTVIPRNEGPLRRQTRRDNVTTFVQVLKFNLE